MIDPHPPEYDWHGVDYAVYDEPVCLIDGVPWEPEDDTPRGRNYAKARKHREFRKGVQWVRDRMWRPRPVRIVRQRLWIDDQRVRRKRNRHRCRRL